MPDPLDEAIAVIVPRAEAALGGTLRGARPLPGGHSGVTLVAELDGERSVVVKATPPGRAPVGRHDVLRQARVMAHVRGTVPVPELLAVVEDDPPLFVMSFERGEAAEPAHDEAPSGDDDALVAARFTVATDLLARLHALDPGPLRGADDAELATPAVELTRWERTLNAVEDPHVGDLGRAAFDRLRSSTPDLWRTTLVHGDYRLGNILFDGPAAVAVIDWEIWSVGDPRVDLGWYLTFSDPRDFPSIGFPARRLPPADALVAAYEAATGSVVPDVPWFRAFGAFKMGVIMAHNLQRHRSGRHVDPFQDRLPPTIDHLLGRAHALAGTEAR